MVRCDRTNTMKSGEKSDGQELGRPTVGVG
jgi:hypothetical protein